LLLKQAMFYTPSCRVLGQFKYSERTTLKRFSLEEFESRDFILFHFVFRKQHFQVPVNLIVMKTNIFNSCPIQQ